MLQKFKRGITGILTFVLAFSMGQFVVSADSSNKINKVASVREGDFCDEVHLRIQPSEYLNMGDTIFIDIENGEFPEDLSEYQYKALGEGNTYDSLKNRHEALMKEYRFDDYRYGRAFRELFEPIMAEYNSVELPYKISFVNKNKLRIELFEIPDAYADEKFMDIARPAYVIPMPFTAVNDGRIKITIDANGTTIRNGVSYVIANCKPMFDYGDADTENGVNINDASVLMQKILDNNNDIPIEKKTWNYIKYVDMDKDGVLTAKDVSIILKMVLMG